MSAVMFAGMPLPVRRVIYHSREFPVILKHVQNHFSYDIMVKSRKREYLIPQYLLRYFCYWHSPITLDNLGRFTMCDHSTISHSLRRVVNLYETNQNFKELFDQIEASVELYIGPELQQKRIHSKTALIVEEVNVRASKGIKQIQKFR